MMKRALLPCLLALTLSACGGESHPSVPELSERPWLYADDFRANPNLHAQDFQTLIIRVDDTLAADPLASSVARSVHAVPYYFKSRTDLAITLDTNAPCIERVELRDSFSRMVLDADLDDPSAYAAVYPGHYTLTIHEVYPLPEHCSSSFVYRPAEEADTPETIATAGESFDSGEGVFRAFRPLRWLDTFARREFFSDKGYLLSLGDTVNVPMGLPTYNITDINEDITLLAKTVYPTVAGQPVPPLTIGDGAHLLSLVPYDGEKGRYTISSKALGADHLYQAAWIAYTPYSGNPWHYGAATACWSKEAYGGYETGDITAQMAFQNNAVYRKFREDYYTLDRFKQRWSGYVMSSDNCPSFGPYEFEIQFETGGFGGHSLASRAASGDAGDNLTLSGVFFASGACRGLEVGNYSYTISLNEVYRYYEDATLLGRLGRDDVALFSGLNFTGEAAVFNVHSSLPSVDVSRFAVRSIRVGHDATISLFDDKDYQGNVATVGIDIPDVSNDPRFRGFGPIRSLNVFRAAEIVISNDCPGCNLQDADLAGHRFDNRNFTRTNFTRADLSGSSLVNARLIDAVLQNARLDNANLKGANMCRAHLNKDPLFQKAATLNGAYLQNVNLAFAEMSGASFVNANFHSMTSMESCIPDIECRTTSCASAHKATMSNADFTGAYLNGTDMSNATMTAAKFTNAFAIGVNFSNSDLSSDPLTGQSGAVFIGTYLFGANFNNARVQGVQFHNAYLDDQVTPPAVKGVAVIYLNSFYSSFPGSPFYETYVCPQVVAPLVTKTGYLPTTDHSVTCPNGQAGPCAGAQWKASIPLNENIFVITYGGRSPWPAPAQCTPERVYLLW